MKTPSKNISASLASQSVPGRGAESISVGTVSGSPSMVVPGSGSVMEAPGGRHERSARNYVDPMSRYGGAGGGATPSGMRKA